MDLYEAFKSIIEKNDIKMLDNASRCEELLKQQGFNGDDLNTKLFFAVLKQNVPLKIRTITYSNKNFSNYTLSIKIFCDLFGKENLSNEYENILIRHISLIVSVFEAEKVIDIDLSTEHHERKTLSLSKAILAILDNHGVAVFENTKSLKSLLDDMCDERNSISEFISFLDRVNAGTVDLESQQEIENIKKFSKLIGQRGYLPLVVILEKIKNNEIPLNEGAIEGKTAEDIWQEQNNANNQSEGIGNLQERTKNNPVDSATVIKTKNVKSHSSVSTVGLWGVFAGLVFLFFLIAVAENSNDSGNTSYSSGQTSNTYSNHSSYNTEESSNITWTLYVKVDGLNVRSAASADSRILGVLEQGDSVTTTDPFKKWIYVRGKYNGYVNSNFLSSDPVQKRGTSSTIQNSNLQDNKTAQEDIEDNLDLTQKDMKSKE